MDLQADPAIGGRPRAFRGVRLVRRSILRLWNDPLGEAALILASVVACTAILKGLIG